MQSFRKLVFVGAAAVAAAGFSGAVAAEISKSHLLTIRLPDGSQEQIRYAGDTPPQVSVQPGWASFSALDPAADLFAPNSAFAALERMSAEMNRQAAAVLQQAAGLRSATLPGGSMQVELGKLPPGVQGYMMVSTTSGNTTCTRTVRYSSSDVNGPPKVLTRTSGACDDAQRGQGLPQPASSTSLPKPHSGLLQTSIPTNQALVQRVSATTG